jgi:hypothetical protein
MWLSQLGLQERPATNPRKETQEKEETRRTEKRFGSYTIHPGGVREDRKDLKEVWHYNSHETTLNPQNILVHPKDKCAPEEQGEVIYQIPCKNCKRSFIGETGRLFKTRLEEHKADVTSNTNSQFTRSQRKISQSTIHKSAITDHTTQENHEIDWENAKIIDKETHKRRRHVKEAIWIKRTKGAINRDEGNYQLSHLYEAVIQQEQHLH